MPPNTAMEASSESPTANPLTTSSLSSLQSSAHLNLLNMMDQLRGYGVSEYVSLPQLVVCGDQSSGKSSVLEAITEIPFPSKDNLCTRFATQIVLRRSPTSSAAVRIIPDAARERSAEERVRLTGFARSMSDFSELGAVIEAAAEAMGIGGGSGTTFSKDILSVEITGPRRPHLTVVDLPGIIQAAAHRQTEEDIALILDMVEGFMRNPRTIILAVISARNDYANQVVLRLARGADPEGKRIVGIITKPDTIPAESESEKAFIGLARNEDEKNVFSLGWHVLRNRSFEERNATFEERNRKEGTFFSTSAWKTFPKETVGIVSLRTRLSTLLFKHIQRGLPGVHDDIKRGLQDCTDQLSKFGGKRSSIKEQRQFLLSLSHSFSSIVKASADGSYENKYFGDVFSEADDDDGSSNECSKIYDGGKERCLRALIQTGNLAFAEEMRVSGHLKHIVAPGSPQLSRCNVKYWQQVISEKEALEWVKPLLRDSRGRELPGTFNPLLIVNLFWQQSQHWESIANDHLESMFSVCLEFLKSLLSTLAEEDVSQSIYQLVANKMDDRLCNSKAELKKLLNDRRRHSITYNHYFTENVQNRRAKRQEDAFRAALDSHVVRNASTTHAIAQVMAAFKSSNKAAMDDFAATEILDQMQAFYKVALKTFVDNVAVQVIERHVLDNIDLIFCPMTVFEIPDEVVSRIAAESVEDQAKRRQLELKKERLENGLKTCNKALSRLEI